MIRVEHEFEVEGTREYVWSLVGDIHAFARCVPTLVEHEIVGPDRATGVVGVTLGAIPVRSRVDIEITERQAPELLLGKAVSYLGDTIVSQLRGGQAGSVPPDAVGTILMRLELHTAGERRTRLVFRCDVDAEGKLERIYQSILRLKADSLKAEFERNVKSALAAAAPLAATQPVASAAAASPAALERRAEPAGSHRGGPTAVTSGARTRRDQEEERPSLRRWVLSLVWRLVRRVLFGRGDR
jgi:carbon monoxide dehydrogenase subunit G